MARGYGKSAAIFRMMRAYRDAEDEMGDMWWKTGQASTEQRVGIGVILGTCEGVPGAAEVGR